MFWVLLTANRNRKFSARVFSDARGAALREISAGRLFYTNQGKESCFVSRLFLSEPYKISSLAQNTYMIFHLIITAILWQDTIGDEQSFSCNVCTSPEYSITKPNAKIYTGNKRWTCSDFEAMARNREFGRDVCSIVQGYALQYCGCDDGFGSPPPEQPVIDYGAVCNVCGGEGGSEIDKVTYPEALVDTGVGIRVTCEFLYEHGFKGAFTREQCKTVQSVVREPCGCGLVANALPTALPTGKPPAPSPTTPPTQGATAESPVTPAPISPNPTSSLTPETTTQPPVSTPESTLDSTSLPTMSATISMSQRPTQFPTEAYSSNQLPTIASTPPPQTIFSLPTTQPEFAPTNGPTSITTSKPADKPSEIACLDSGEACEDASECCQGLCDVGVCSEEVFTLTNPVTSSARQMYGVIGLGVCVLLGLFL